jgi:hypothetical protein
VSGIHAARVAAALRRDPRYAVELVEGRYGEFTVLLEGEEVIGSGALGFLGVMPSIRKIRALLDQKAQASSSSR